MQSPFRSNYLYHIVIIKTLKIQGNLCESLEGKLVNFVYK